MGGSQTTSDWGSPNLLNREPWVAVSEVSHCIQTREKSIASYTHIFLLQVLCSCSLGSCRGCACPYCHSCWLPYNTEECECRSGPILRTRTITPTHTFCIPVHLTLSLSHTSLPFFTHWLSHSLCSPPLFLLSSCSMVSALLAVLLTDFSWMSWLG